MPSKITEISIFYTFIYLRGYLLLYWLFRILIFTENWPVFINLISWGPGLAGKIMFFYNLGYFTLFFENHEKWSKKCIPGKRAKSVFPTTPGHHPIWDARNAIFFIFAISGKSHPDALSWQGNGVQFTGWPGFFSDIWDFGVSYRFGGVSISLCPELVGKNFIKTGLL